MTHNVWSKGFFTKITAIALVASTGAGVVTTTAAYATTTTSISSSTTTVDPQLQQLVNDLTAIHTYVAGSTGYHDVQTVQAAIRSLTASDWNTILYGTGAVPSNATYLTGAGGVIPSLISYTYTDIKNDPAAFQTALNTQVATAVSHSTQTVSVTGVDLETLYTNFQSAVKGSLLSAITSNSSTETIVADALNTAITNTKSGAFRTLGQGYGLTLDQTNLEAIMNRFKDAVISKTSSAIYSNAKTTMLSAYASVYGTSTGGGSLPSTGGGSDPGSTLTTVVTTSTVGATGGTLSATSGGSTVKVDIPAGAFGSNVTVDVTTGDTSKVTGVASNQTVAVAFGIHFSTDVTPGKPITLTIANKNITVDTQFFKVTDKGLVPVTAAVTNGQAVITFTSDPDFVGIVAKESTLKPGQKGIYFNAKEVAIVPGIVKDNTTYMPIWYVMHALQSAGVTSTWDGKNWHLTVPSGINVDLSNVKVGKGDMGIYVNGTLVHKVYGMYAVDPSTKRLTTYMPVWYLMQILNRANVTSTWDGSRWHMAFVAK